MLSIQQAEYKESKESETATESSNLDPDQQPAEERSSGRQTTRLRNLTLPIDDMQAIDRRDRPGPPILTLGDPTLSFRTSGFGGGTVTTTDNNHDEDLIEEAIRASLQDFMSSTSPLHALQQELSHSDSDDGLDWACALCTYVNSTGRHCAMCGTRRT